MTLRETLEKIQQELTPINRNKILVEGVNKKLGRTEREYNDAVELNCKYILSRSNYKALMAINRFNKRKEKNDEEESEYGFIEII